MPDYLYNNNPVPESQLLRLSKEHGMSLDDLIEELGVTIDTESKSDDVSLNLPSFNSKDLVLNEKKPEWWLGNLEDKVVDKLNKQLKNLGWEAEDETGEWSDVLGGNMLSIYKTGGSDEDTKLVIDLQKFTKKFGAQSASDINKALKDHIQGHIDLHSGSDNTETQEAVERVRTMVGDDLISVETDKDDPLLANNVERQKILMRNAQLKSILKPLDDKIIHTIAKKNSIPLTDADKNLSVDEFLKKYTNEINVGYDYERLLGQSGGIFSDSVLQDVLEYYKNKTGQGKAFFGLEDTDRDAWIFGATSWDPEGEFASLSERQIEKYVKEGIQMYADHQASTINKLKENTEDIVLDHEGLTVDELVIGEYQKN